MLVLESIQINIFTLKNEPLTYGLRKCRFTGEQKMQNKHSTTNKIQAPAFNGARDGESSSAGMIQYWIRTTSSNSYSGNTDQNISLQIN